MSLPIGLNLPLATLEFEQALEIASRGLESEFEYGFCGCGGIVGKRGRRWICNNCGARYDNNPSVPAPVASGPPQGHRTNVRGSNWDKHTGRRAGGREKKDTRRQREFELSAAALELMEIPPESFLPEGESGLGAATALAHMVALLSNSGNLNPADTPLALALALRQVDASGKHVSTALNKPDISYLDGGGRRINIEIETRNPFQHLPQLRKDPNATNVFVKVHPWTGQVEEGWILKPNQKGNPEKLTPIALQNLQATLPKPVRDPTLTFDPKTGKQRRKFQPSLLRMVRTAAPVTRLKAARTPPRRANAGLGRLVLGKRSSEAENEFYRALNVVAGEFETASWWR